MDDDDMKRIPNPHMTFKRICLLELSKNGDVSKFTDTY